MTADKQAFLDLVMPHVDVVWNVARRVARYPIEPEDLVQETYMRAYSAFGSYRDGNVRAWLVSICLNAARSHGRRAKRRPLEVPGVDASVVADVDVESTAIRSLERETLAEALRELPEPQRIAIVLMDAAGMTAQETAEATGAPRGTTLSRVHRGRRRLAQLLREKDAIDGV